MAARLVDLERKNKSLLLIREYIYNIGAVGLDHLRHRNPPH